jgi:hypothetical protein
MREVFNVLMKVDLIACRYRPTRRRAKKKAGVIERPEVFDHAGLLVNGPPYMPGLPFS